MKWTASVLSSLLLCAPVLAATNFIAANDPAITYQGRTLINADGSRTFDWEGVQIEVNINGRCLRKMHDPDFASPTHSRPVMT
jgi:hypothetical protein